MFAFTTAGLATDSNVENWLKNPENIVTLVFVVILSIILIIVIFVVIWKVCQTRTQGNHQAVLWLNSQISTVSMISNLPTDYVLG